MPTSSLPAAISLTLGQPTVWQLIGQIIAIIDQVLVPLLFAVAFIVFLFGVYRYFIEGGADEEKRKSGRDFVVFGLIGFFLMITVWGIVNVLVASLGFGSQNRPALPCFTGGPLCGGGGGININISI